LARTCQRLHRVDLGIALFEPEPGEALRHVAGLDQIGRDDLALMGERDRGEVVAHGIETELQQLSGSEIDALGDAVRPGQGLGEEGRFEGHGLRR
jgi:hypothetical protein